MGRTKREAGALDALGKRVERWRASCGGKGSRVPEEIWSAAVEMARTAGPWATSKATGLNYRSLAERLRQGTEQSPSETCPLPFVEQVVAAPADATTPVAFVEVAMPVAASREIAGKTVVELEQSSRRLRIETTGPLDVVALARAFWRDERCSN